MLDRIEMDVVDVALEISLVTDCVLPEATLPERLLAIGMGRDRDARACECVREPAFDQAHPDGESCVSIRQRHDDMKMVRQHDNGVDREWMDTARGAKSRT